MRPWSRAWLETSVTSSVAPRADAFGHQLEEVARLGRGVDGGTHLAGDVVLDGADEDRVAGGGVEKRFGEEGSGGFAVGAGDAGGGELALGMGEEGGRGLGERAAAVLDFEDGQAGLEDERDDRRSGAESVMMPSAPAAMALST